MIISRNRLSDQDYKRFMALVVKSTTKPFCWLWQGGKLKDGYGEIKINGINLTASRVSYEHFVGPLIPKLCVLHTCDNPSCVNPGHLYLGTHRNNINDCLRKDRWANSKLDSEKVRQIRKAHTQGISQKELNTQYGISDGRISQIVNNKAWKHVK